MVRCGVASVCVSEVTDFTALGERWRDLEQRSECSFFQSWTWVGCLAAERFPDAVLVEATEAGRTVALGLFNRVRHRLGPPTLFLAENGTAELDCPYVEQNGILTEAGCDADLTALCLRSLAAAHVWSCPEWVHPCSRRHGKRPVLCWPDAARSRRSSTSLQSDVLGATIWRGGVPIRASKFDVPTGSTSETGRSGWSLPIR